MFTTGCARESTTYDGMGRVIELETSPDDSEALPERQVRWYDPVGNPTRDETTRGSWPAGDRTQQLVTTYEYDPLHRLSGIRQGEGEDARYTQLGYDLAGGLTWRRQPGGTETHTLQRSLTRSEEKRGRPGGRVTQQPFGARRRWDRPPRCDR